MCGIVGAAWTSRGVPLTEGDLRRMTNVIRHRGPDDEGIYNSQTASPDSPTPPHCLLGFRRLSIIDLSTGHQPLCNEHRDVWIVFNGEVYNYQELRRELESRGHVFRTHTDTETIVHAYEEYGTDCVRHLRGMFAFAIWDNRRRRLFLARDRIGKKPLFYRAESDRLTFASELKALLEVPGAPREVDPTAIDLYLTYQYVPHPHSILKGYHKLSPGHWATWTDGKLDVQRYWSPPYNPDADPRDFADPELARSASWSPDEWRSRLRSTLTESVRLRLRSDVPLGAFLSGGIDSTIISGLMQQLSDRPIHTFSIGFPVAQFDERAYAREAAQKLGTQHHEYLVEPSALSMLPKLAWHYDEPFGDSSAIPTMYLSEVTRKEVTVALSGDGGDELFAGYDRYRAVRMAGHFDRYLPSFVRAMFGAKIWQKLPGGTEQRSLTRRAKRFAEALAKSPEERYLRWIGIFDRDLRDSLYSSDFRTKLNGYDSTDFLRET